ncbi:MAG: hypothetical protein V1909_03770 [Candidatus Micrarchaeota archaeon]
MAENLAPGPNEKPRRAQGEKPAGIGVKANQFVVKTPSVDNVGALLESRVERRRLAAKARDLGKKARAAYDSARADNAIEQLAEVARLYGEYAKALDELGEAKQAGKARRMAAETIEALEFHEYACSG